MGQQEIGHAQVLTDMLGPRAAKPCNYTYPFSTVRQSIDFSQQLTRWGESGVYGFLNLLDNRAVGQILLQSITTEARQQMVFRQFEGLFPMPVWVRTLLVASRFAPPSLTCFPCVIATALVRGWCSPGLGMDSSPGVHHRVPGR